MPKTRTDVLLERVRYAKLELLTPFKGDFGKVLGTMIAQADTLPSIEWDGREVAYWELVAMLIRLEQTLEDSA